MDCNNINKYALDDRIQFEPIKHEYFIDGSKDNVISVTTYLHKFFSPFITKSMAEICSNSKTSEYSGQPIEEIIKIWDDIREEGSRKHSAIDQYLRGLEPDSKPPYSFYKFMEKNNTFIPYRTEWVIFDCESRIAGQVDALFKAGDKYILVDWKNTKQIRTEAYRNKTGIHKLSRDILDCNYQHYSLQLNIYRHIIEKNTGIHIDEMYIGNFPPSRAEEGIFEEYLVKYMDMEPFFNLRMEELAIKS